MAFRNRLPEVWREGGIWSPIREMSRLQRRIDRMFGDFLAEPVLESRGFLESESEGFVPACDIEETEKEYTVSFDLPGIRKEDLKIDLQDHQLTVSGERKEETKGRTSRERFYGSFLRSFTLPANIDTAKLEAHYDNGVLQVMLPKSAEVSGKRIAIHEGRRLNAPEKELTEKRPSGKGEKAA